MRYLGLLLDVFAETADIQARLYRLDERIASTFQFFSKCHDILDSEIMEASSKIYRLQTMIQVVTLQIELYAKENDDRELADLVFDLVNKTNSENKILIL